MLLACHGRVHGVAAFHYWFFYAAMLETLIVAAIFVITRPSRTLSLRQLSCQGRTIRRNRNPIRAW